jgi:hypothetical protein
MMVGWLQVIQNQRRQSKAAGRKDDDLLLQSPMLNKMKLDANDVLIRTHIYSKKAKNLIFYKVKKAHFKKNKSIKYGGSS